MVLLLNVGSILVITLKIDSTELINQATVSSAFEFPYKRDIASLITQLCHSSIKKFLD